MDNKKKKKAKRKAKAAANAGESSALDHGQWQHRSSEKTLSLVAGNNEILSTSLLGTVTSQTELRKDESDQSAPAATHSDTEESQNLEPSDHRCTDGRLDDTTNLDGTDLSGGENLNGEHFDSCKNEEHVGRAQMQALIIQMTQMQALAQEKEQVVRELEELQEALAIERDTAELLRDQMTYLQGDVAERNILEMGTQKQIQRLSAENVYLQGLVADLREKVEKLEEELERSTEERGRLEQENTQIISRKEKEEGERAAELIKKVEQLEQEREDLEEKQSKLKQEGRQMIVKMEQEGEKMEQLSKQMVAKMETERQSLELEIRQMALKMEQEQEKLDMERLQMKVKLEQEQLNFDQHNKEKIAHLTTEGDKLEKENRQLLWRMEQEREAFYQEINELKASMGQEREILNREHHLLAENLAQERKQVVFEFEQKKAKLERDREMLDHDRRQITAKMTALEAGLKQLESETSVRNGVFKDLATATDVDSSKKWGGSWHVYGEDPLAEAVAVAEEARMQRMAMAQTVDKLLAENVGLMEKVNDQAVMINDLTKLMSTGVKGSKEISAEERVDREQEVIWRSDTGADTGDSKETNTGKQLPKSDSFAHYGGHRNGYRVQSISGYDAGRSIDENVELSNSGHNDDLTAADPRKLDMVQESSAISAGGEPFEKSGSSESFTTLYEITEIRDDSSGPAELVKSHEEHTFDRSKPPGKASSLIKAPVRFFSFVAGYISGADLVKQ